MCDWCVEAMREPTLMGQSLVSPGRCDEYAQRAIAGRLHELRYHVHCGMRDRRQRLRRTRPTSRSRCCRYRPS